MVADELSRRVHLLTVVKGDVTCYQELKGLYEIDEDVQSLWARCVHR